MFICSPPILWEKINEYEDFPKYFKKIPLKKNTQYGEYIRIANSKDVDWALQKLVRLADWQHGKENIIYDIKIATHLPKHYAEIEHKVVMVKWRAK